MNHIVCSRPEHSYRKVVYVWKSAFLTVNIYTRTVGYIYNHICSLFRLMTLITSV